MQTSESVLCAQSGDIAIVTINRPRARNALSLEVLQRLGQILDAIRTNDEVRAVILTGAGAEAFSAGADIRYLNGATPLEVREFARLAVRVTHQIEHLGKVVVAALNGYTYGGGLELAESCMIRIAASDARLGHPEVRIGAIAGFGGTTRLPRLVGKGRASEMLLRGRIIYADEAMRIGLVHGVVAGEILIQEAEAIIREILMQSPVAVSLTWEALHRGLDLALEESAELGADFFGLVASTEDFHIGTWAFLEKKQPTYIGS